MPDAAGTADAGGSSAGLLGIYLNDHLAGATGGVDLFNRAARAHQGTATGDMLKSLATEVAEDRAALLEMVRALGVPIRRYKLYAGWLGEKVGRLKPNGRLFGRSPLSTLVEIEAMRIAVEGKASGWRTLRILADHEGRLNTGRLDGLLDRARRQAGTLETLHARSAAEIFSMA